MRAARLHGIGDIRVAEEPAPPVRPGAVVVQVTAVGICGSDLHWWGEGAIGDAAIERPLVLGHEAAGIIASGSRRGERVAIDPAIPCETCRACRDGYRNLCPYVVFAGHGSTDGALRELMTWPAGRLHPLPDDVPDACGALLEPLGVAIQCVDLGHLPFGGSAAVVGCGPIGLLLIQLLRLSGAATVLAVEPLAHRQRAAERAGATTVTAPESAASELAGREIDVAFEAAGTGDAVGLAIAAARPGGRVILAGIPADDTVTFPASAARRKGLTIAFVRRMNEVYPRAISLAARGAVDLDWLVTSQVPLADAAAAFNAAAGRTGLKVLIEPQR